MAARGARLINQAQRATEAAQGGIVTHGVEKAKDGVQTTASYPRYGLGSADPRHDERLAEKMQMVAAGGGTGQTPLGMVTATDQDFEVLRRKRDTEAFANFDAWVGKNFHTNDLATRKFLQEIWPEYYEARERAMVERAKFALRVNLLNLRGARNEEDLALEWALNTGRVKLDKDWDRIGASVPGGGYDAVQKDQQQRFRNGLFSVRRYLSEKDREENAAVDTNPFKPVRKNAGDFQPFASSFPGAEVPNEGRYPAFIANVVSPHNR